MKRLRTTKKPIAAFLATAVCISMIPFSAQAAPSLDGKVAAALCDAEELAMVDNTGISAQAAQQKVATPSQAEIRAYYNKMNIDITSSPRYAEDPKTTSPHIAGALRQDNLDNARNMLNYVRFVAGIPSNVTLNNDYNKQAQAAALVNAANYKSTGKLILSHTPAQPFEMPDSLYALGKTGAMHSNLSVGYVNPASSILGYMDDSDATNIVSVGHRRWCLNPSMKATGFGQADSYSAMYAQDGASSNTTYEAVMWPAANMPLSLFGKDQAWSVSLDFAPYGGNISKVVLNRTTDGKTWTLSPNSGQGEFHTSINGSSYIGSGSCVIFRPDDITYRAGDEFQVTLTGQNGKTFSYAVEFFRLELTEPMYRVYNPNSGEHFYTASAGERNNLVNVGWNYEGVGWTAPTSSTTPVYRLYSGTDHHYTTSAFERDHLIEVGWSYEGIGWYSDDNEEVPLYRQFNPNVQPGAPRNNSGSHNYTTSKWENDQLVKVGWRAEGIGWYGCA